MIRPIETLDPGLRRDDGWRAVVKIPLNRCRPIYKLGLMTSPANPLDIALYTDDRSRNGSKNTATPAQANASASVND
ncbi:MAG: hypothetical protein EBV64_09080 [Oxalobacteraceae bacterium]|jgi:hypothetical protein|nr:hypothetical protein [Oxalobacteraceae bacterium]